MSPASFRVRESEILMEKDGFKLVFRPLMALAGKLSNPLSTELHANTAYVKYPEGKGRLVFEEWGPESIVVTAEADGLSDDGLIVELRSSFEGFEKLLLFHFAHDPEKYFSESQEPYQYPQLRETEEFEYCAWSYPIHASGFKGLPRNIKVSQLIAEGAGSYAFLLPISNSGARGYVSRFERDEFSILLNRMVAGAWDRVFLFAFATSSNPYRAVESAYESAFTLTGRRDVLRKKKSLPEIFKYLGWCSWNACWRDPTEEKIVATFKSLLENSVTPGFALIDDGWQEEQDMRIKDLEPSVKKFPSGFKEVVDRLKSMGARYVGLWHTLNIHWRGVAKGSRLAEKWGKHLIEAEGNLVPNPADSFDLFRDWYSKLREWGFDFVKVDNQSSVGYMYAGKIPVEEAAEMLHKGLEAAAYINSLEVLNCMAQQPENAFSWFRSAIARNCVDYIVPHKKSRNKLHLYFNAYNALFMSQVVWPDWDMFQSHDPWALQQAVARAVSGGPIYLTDEAGKSVVEIVKPLAFSDGFLPLPDGPALPTKDILMRDPYNEAVPLKVFTKVSLSDVGVYGVVAAFNITKDDMPVKGIITPFDAMLPGEKHVVFEYFSEELREESFSFELNPMSVKLFILAPWSNWLTLIGLKNIYIMPRGIDFAVVYGDEAFLRLREPGILVAKTKGKVMVEGGELMQEEPLLKIRCCEQRIRLKLVR
jgi:hypothetical protein